MGGICFFNTAIAWGGGEKWHFEVSAYLHAKGYKVWVVAHSKSELLRRLKASNIPCVGINISNTSFLNPLQHGRLRQLLSKEKLDSIVLNLSRDVKIAGSCAKAVGIKRIIYRRGSAIPIANTFLNRYYFRSVITDVLANSEATKKTVLQNNPRLFPEKRIKVIHNGIALDKVIQTSTLISKTTPKETRFVIASLGRLEAQKNQKFLIYMAKELVKRKLNFSLVIGGEGRLRRDLEALIANLKLTKYVFLKGFIEKPLDFIAQADIFVLPSLWEGFGYVLAEAALCKKPIVAFDLSSNPELVIHQKTGYLIQENALDAFADAVEDCYQNPEKAKSLGAAGFAHITENFDKEKKLLEIEDYLMNG
ncbi:MAG: glycosyltransferase [Bacteroidota bacterium]